MQPPIFVLQLKADLSLEDCVDFINAITDDGKKQFKSLFVALPFTRLEEMADRFSDAGIFFGSDRINSADEESFTSPIAAKMVKETGACFTLIGSKEEKDLLSLSKNQLMSKVKRAQAADLHVLYCIQWDHLQEELEALKEIDFLSQIDQPILICELPFNSFKSYLPSQEELTSFWEKIQEELAVTFGERGKNIRLIASLPADIVGFSSLIDEMPFAGAFFTKSGVYPHAVHRETLELFHVHSENSDQNL